MVTIDAKELHTHAGGEAGTIEELAGKLEQMTGVELAKLFADQQTTLRGSIAGKGTFVFMPSGVICAEKVLGNNFVFGVRKPMISKSARLFETWELLQLLCSDPGTTRHAARFMLYGASPPTPRVKEDNEVAQEPAAVADAGEHADAVAEGAIVASEVVDAEETKPAEEDEVAAEHVGNAVEEVPSHLLT